MLVDGYKGQKVQDVKKPIQKMMTERVRRVKNKVHSNDVSNLQL